MSNLAIETSSSSSTVAVTHFFRPKSFSLYFSISREADSDSEADGERLLELEEALREYEPPPANSSQHHQLHLAIEPLR